MLYFAFQVKVWYQNRRTKDKRDKERDEEPFLCGTMPSAAVERHSGLLQCSPRDKSRILHTPSSCHPVYNQSAYPLHDFLKTIPYPPSFPHENFVKLSERKQNSTSSTSQNNQCQSKDNAVIASTSVENFMQSKIPLPDTIRDQDRPQEHESIELKARKTLNRVHFDSLLQFRFDSIPEGSKRHVSESNTNEQSTHIITKHEQESNQGTSQQKKSSELPLNTKEISAITYLSDRKAEQAPDNTLNKQSCYNMSDFSTKFLLSNSSTGYSNSPNLSFAYSPFRHYQHQGSSGHLPIVPQAIRQPDAPRCGTGHWVSY